MPVGRGIAGVIVTVTVPFAPYAIAGALIDIVVGTWFTVCERVDEGDVAKFASPP